MKTKTMIVAAVASALLAGMAVFAMGHHPVTSETGTVTVEAEVNPMIELTVLTPTLDFGTVDPGVAESLTARIEVSSNKAYTLTGAHSGGDAPAVMGLSRSMTAAVNGFPGEDTVHDDIYTIDVPWDSAPRDYSATILYTATQ